MSRDRPIDLNSPAATRSSGENCKSRVIDLRMTSDRDAEAECGRFVPAGTRVEYCAHLGRGMVRVRLEDGTEVVVHPHCFEQLR